MEPSAARKLQAHIYEAEVRMTPRDFMAWIKRAAREPDAADLIQSNETRQFLTRKWWLKRFQKEDFGPHVSLYRGRTWTKGRGLLVGVTAGQGGLTIPTPALLQCVSARKWDVLMLRDPDRNQYRRGCAGFADTFPALAERVAEIGRPYAHCTVVGTSLGGLAAIRLALTMPGVRGVSVAGVPARDINSLFKDSFPGLAYDPLCACLPEVSRDLWFVHGADHRADRRTAKQFATITGGKTFGIDGCKTHNIFALLWRKQLLSPFLAAILDGRRQGRKLRAELVRIGVES
jgi:pimeloyl-ACP methyl ester carboxylesterase